MTKCTTYLPLRLTFLASIAHKFSMGFRSGLLDGLCITIVSVAENQSFRIFAVCTAVLSYWKMKSDLAASSAYSLKQILTVPSNFLESILVFMNNNGIFLP